MLKLTRRSVLLGCAVAGAALGQGCDSKPARVDVSLADNGRVVAAEVGAKIVVALGVIGPFYFGDPIVSSGAVRFVAKSDEFPSQPNPGGGKTQRYTFEALSAGEALITIPRDGPFPESSAFRITVQVY